MECPRAIVLETDPELRALALSVLREFDFKIAELDSSDEIDGVMERYGSQVCLMIIGVSGGAELARLASRRWPWIKVLLTSASEPPRRLPQAVTYMPRPWGLNIVMHTQSAARAPFRASA